MAQLKVSVLVSLLTFTACAKNLGAEGGQADLGREDFSLDGPSGLSLHVRVVSADRLCSGPPLILVHGAGAGGVAAFDLPAPGPSLAADLARGGRCVYLPDIRGFGASARPSELEGPPEGRPPAVTWKDAVEDLVAVTDWVRRRHGGARVQLLGWATGGQWATAFASLHPAAVGHLVVINALHSVDAPWSLRERLQDPARPGELSPELGAYQLRDARSLLRPWDASIPFDDKSVWRDPSAAAGYVEETLRGDPTSGERVPPSLRVPTGPLADSFQLSRGRRLWDVGQIRAATLIVRSERDFWTRPEDVSALQRELTRAASVRTVLLPDATHHVILDRAERGRAQLLRELEASLPRK